MSSVKIQYAGFDRSNWLHKILCFNKTNVEYFYTIFFLNRTWAMVLLVTQFYWRLSNLSNMIINPNFRRGTQTPDNEVKGTSRFNRVNVGYPRIDGGKF